MNAEKIEPGPSGQTASSKSKRKRGRPRKSSQQVKILSTDQKNDRLNFMNDQTSIHKDNKILKVYSSLVNNDGRVDDSCYEETANKEIRFVFNAKPDGEDFCRDNINRMNELLSRLTAKRNEMKLAESSHENAITKMTRFCSNCQVKLAILFCCLHTQYCCESCQRKHWPSHAASCVRPKD